MGILNTELNYDKVLSDLSACCLGKENCGGCEKAACIIGYAQEAITQCFKDGVTFVENGKDRIPVTDLKLYNEEEMEKGIAHILKQCRSCKEEHFDNCIISVLRNCYEIGLFGEPQEYEGSNFRYLNHIHNLKPEIADNIIEEFHNTEE